MTEKQKDSHWYLLKCYSWKEKTTTEKLAEIYVETFASMVKVLIRGPWI